MITTIIRSLLFLFLAFCVLSCSEDDDSDTPTPTSNPIQSPRLQVIRPGMSPTTSPSPQDSVLYLEIELTHGPGNLQEVTVVIDSSGTSTNDRIEYYRQTRTLSGASYTYLDSIALVVQPSTGKGHFMDITIKAQDVTWPSQRRTLTFIE